MEEGRRELTQEKEFYKDVDKETRGSCCTCQTMFLAFLFLTIGSVIGNYMLLKRLHIIKPKTKSQTSITYDIPAATKKSQYNKTLDITQDDLQNRIVDKKLLILPLSDKKIYIKPDGIYFEGQVPLASQLVSLKMVPGVENGKLVVNEVTIKSGPATFGNEFSGTIRNKINEGLDNVIGNSLAVEGVQLMDEKMVVGGR